PANSGRNGNLAAFFCGECRGCLVRRLAAIGGTTLQAGLCATLSAQCGELGGEDRRRLITEGRMRSLGIVDVGPAGDGVAGMVDAEEQGLVQKLVTQEGVLYFTVTVSVDHNALEERQANLPILPGMISEVSVITGDRTVLGYMLKPVLKLKDRALTER